MSEVDRGVVSGNIRRCMKFGRFFFNSALTMEIITKMENSINDYMNEWMIRWKMEEEWTKEVWK